MVAFAVGGLMGDTLFHLLPEIFVGEDRPGRATFVLVEPNRNLLLGVAILVGFLTFVAMDKGLRIATGGKGGHDHSHTHDKDEGRPTSSTADKAASTSSAVALGSGGVKSRKKGSGTTASSRPNGTPSEVVIKEVSPSAKLGGYLNLM